MHSVHCETVDQIECAGLLSCIVHRTAKLMLPQSSVSLILQRVKPELASFEIILDVFERKPSAVERFSDEAGGV